VAGLKLIDHTYLTLTSYFCLKDFYIYTITDARRESFLDHQKIQ